MQACENGHRVADKTWAVVEAKLEETWSPQQISGYLKVNGHPGVSHESIYRRIHADKSAGGMLHRTLRCQKARKKRYEGREQAYAAGSAAFPSAATRSDWVIMPTRRSPSPMMGRW